MRKSARSKKAEAAAAAVVAMATGFAFYYAFTFPDRSPAIGGLILYISGPLCAMAFVAWLIEIYVRHRSHRELSKSMGALDWVWFFLLVVVTVGLPLRLLPDFRILPESMTETMDRTSYVPPP